jgi:hypothetical protein
LIFKLEISLKINDDDTQEIKNEEQRLYISFDASKNTPTGKQFLHNRI